MKKRILTWLLALVMVFSMLPTTALATDEPEGGEFRVVISMEGLTLGQGFYVEPRIYTLDKINELVAKDGFGPYTEDDLTAGIATLAMLIDNELEYTMTGTWESGAYLQKVRDIDSGEIDIPAIITENGGPSNEENDGNDDDYLGEFDYDSMAGWMITVNHGLTNVGCADFILKSGITGSGYGDGYQNYGNTYVIRWQFTLYGYGMDLGFGGWGGAGYFNAANKDMLYTQYALSTDAKAKAAALSVMENLTATQGEVDTALATLKAAGTTDPGTTDPGNPDPGNPDPGNPPPATPQDVSKVLNDTMDQLAKTVTAPAFGTGAGEWTVLDLARGGYYALDSQYFKDYYSRIVETVNQKAASVNLDGALHKVKSTENSRLIMALSAIGKDAASVGNWDLIKPYSTQGMKWITKQGINGPIFTLIALDTHNYPTTDATIRQQCVDYILGKELSGGGWALSGTEADPDITAMALQALVNYKDQPEVAAAAERAFAKLSAIQRDNGGYASWGSVNSESIAQVIVATTAWGIDPDTDPRFVKNGKSAVDALLTFYVEEGRGFAHVLENSPGYVGGEVNGMATDQACYALVAYNRFQNGKTALYDMSDVNFPCTAHKFGAWTVTTPATCTKDGVETRTCEVCQTAETRAVKATGHKFGTWTVTTPATCTKDGVETRTCEACQTAETRAVKATGHKFGAWSVTTPATCTKDGVETRTCEVCQTAETRAVKATGHKFGTWTVTTPATCTKDGVETRTCEVCQTAETRAVKATGHKFGAWEITKPASLTETGVRTRTCTVCQETETQTIPKLRRGPAQPPAATQPGATQPANTSAVKSSQTGDGSQMTLWLGGALLSAAALAVLVRQKKRIVK